MSTQIDQSQSSIPFILDQMQEGDLKQSEEVNEPVQLKHNNYPDNWMD